MQDKIIKQGKTIEDFLISNGKITYFGNAVLLAIHIGLLLMFYCLGARIMACVNVFSVSFYISMFWVIPRNPLHYLRLISGEIFIHMLLATFCMGWDCGFQFYCIFLIPVIYYCDHLYKKIGDDRVHALRNTIFAGICFLAGRVYTYIYGSVYQINNAMLANSIYIVNVVVMFAFLIGYMASYQKLTLQAEQKLTQLAEIDMLTQLPNRRHLEEIVRLAFQRARAGEENLAVAILDIDDFKKVNDSYGHLAGDAVLCQVAEELKKLSSGDISTCRWGGEEFLSICTSENAYAQLVDGMEELRRNIEQQEHIFEGQRISVTVTIGVSRYQQGIQRLEELTRLADQNLYQGKTSGKNQVVTDEGTLQEK